ncbi:MAG: hypothetical protein KBF88_06135 [Polyangiaceae bacterium]|nr:hypothetical protein [Polyangiaceae bacterium]
MNVQTKLCCSVLLSVSFSGFGCGETQPGLAVQPSQLQAMMDVRSLGEEGSRHPVKTPSQYYSGAEWLIDSVGNVLSSTAVLFERKFDPSHGRMEVHTIRARRSANEGPAENRAEFSLVGAETNPWRVEARAANTTGTRSAFAEQVHGNVLVSSDTVRDEAGRIVATRITNATPLSENEFVSWSQEVLATR